MQHSSQLCMEMKPRLPFRDLGRPFQCKAFLLLQNQAFQFRKSLVIAQGRRNPKAGDYYCSYLILRLNYTQGELYITQAICHTLRHVMNFYFFKNLRLTASRALVHPCACRAASAGMSLPLLVAAQAERERGHEGRSCKVLYRVMPISSLSQYITTRQFYIASIILVMNTLYCSM